MVKTDGEIQEFKKNPILCLPNFTDFARENI